MRVGRAAIVHGDVVKASCAERLDGRLNLLKEDFAAIEDIERQMALFKEDMQREFRFRLSDVDNILREFENRGMSFFDDTMRMVRVMARQGISRCTSAAIGETSKIPAPPPPPISTRGRLIA